MGGPTADVSQQKPDGALRVITIGKKRPSCCPSRAASGSLKPPLHGQPQRYAGARFYMAVFGRWGTTDPLADDFPAWSPYNYVQNNPLSSPDPTGRVPQWRIDIHDTGKVAIYKDGRDEMTFRVQTGGESTEDSFRAVLVVGTDRNATTVSSTGQRKAEHILGHNVKAQQKLAEIGSARQVGFVGGMSVRGRGARAMESAFAVAESTGGTLEELGLLGGPLTAPLVPLGAAIGTTGTFGRHTMTANRGALDGEALFWDLAEYGASGAVSGTYNQGVRNGALSQGGAQRAQAVWNRFIGWINPNSNEQ